MATTKPALEGLVLRPYAGEDDVAHTVRIVNAEMSADRMAEHVALGDRLADYRNPSEMFDPWRDVTLAQVDGQVVGYGVRQWVDTTDGLLREYRVGGAVLPEWRRRGIGSALLAHNERLARQLAATHDTPRAQVFGSWSGEHQAGAVVLFSTNGYEPVRWFFLMTRPTLDGVAHVPLPDGFELRPITPELVKAVWNADIDAFQDHWGGFDSSDASLQRWLDSPGFDPSLWLVAFDDAEVAGGVINGIEAEENAALGLQRGWLHSVFTRRRWRKRGLALALIARSLALLRERGMTSAVLGVDADNPTGALGLYERNGFEVTERSTAWRKVMVEQ